MNEIPVSPVCLGLLITGPLHCVQPAPGVWGLYLLVSCVSVGENVDCICSFIQEIFIEATIMNKADRVSAVVELYY